MSLKYEILEDFGTIGDDSKNLVKHLTLIEWNGREAKYDLRAWDEDFEKMSKGITLTKEELLELKELLNDLEL